MGILDPIDRWAVADLLATICFASDRRDRAALLALLDEGCVADFGPAGVHRGATRVVDAILGVLETVDSTQHELTSSVAVATPDGALVESYWQAAHLKGAAMFTVAGEYVDELRRTAVGEWMLTRRTVTPRWTSGDPAVLGLDI